MAIGVTNQKFSGSEDNRVFPRPTKDNEMSSAATISIGTWNCGGLTRVKKDIANKCDLDILCLTERHKWKDNDKLMIYSEEPPETNG